MHTSNTHTLSHTLRYFSVCVSMCVCLSYTRYAIHATHKCKDTRTYVFILSHTLRYFKDTHTYSHTQKKNTHTQQQQQHTQRGQVDTLTEVHRSKAALNQRAEKGRSRPAGPRPSALSFNFSSWSESVAAYL